MFLYFTFIPEKKMGQVYINATTIYILFKKEKKHIRRKSGMYAFHLKFEKIHQIEA